MSHAQVKRKRRIFRREDVPLYFMALPTVVVLLVFSYVPMLGLVMAFQKLNVAKGIFASEFVGLKNFEFLFSTTDAFIITRNTVCYNLVFIVVNMALAIALSLVMSSLRFTRLAKVYQTVFMMPYFLSWAVVNIVVYAFLDRNSGLVNTVMKSLGKPLGNWYHMKELWPPLLVLINAWKGVGYQTVLYLAVITSINTEYYEAAELDGATKLQQALYITIPHLRFMVGISLILSMASIFRGDFGLFYVVTRNTGTLYPVTDVIDTYIYRSLMYLNDVGMATAAGFYQSAVGLIVVLIVNKIVSKIDPDSAMF